MQLQHFYGDTGGFGTLLITCGKDKALRERRQASMRAFMGEVTPALRDFAQRQNC